MKRLRAGRWQFTVGRSSTGGVLMTLTRHDHSWQVHAQRLVHRPIERR